MKNLIIAALALGSGFVCATTPTLTSITQPLYFLGSAGDLKIQFIEVPKILNNSSAMFWISLFSDPTAVQGSDGDLNLISIYGISVELTSEDKDGRVTSITIDATRAKKPERYPLSVTDAVTATEKAVRIEFPDETKTKIIIKGSSTAPKDFGGHAQLITAAGTHSFPEQSVAIAITGDEPNELNFTMSFDLPNFKGQTGTGKGHPMKLAPGKWAAQFVAPNQLWIFDGLGQVHLYERTLNPSGFKASQSSLVPALLAEAPEELREIISRSNPPDAQAPEE